MTLKKKKASKTILSSFRGLPKSQGIIHKQNKVSSYKQFTSTLMHKWGLKL